MGGVEFFTDNIAKELKSINVKVIIVTCAINDSDIGVSETDGVCIVRLPSKSLLGGRFLFPLNSVKADQLLEWVNDQPIDYALVNQRFFPLSIKGIKFAKEKDVPVLVMDHGSAHLTMSNRLLDFFIRIYEHFMSSIIKMMRPNYCAVSNRSAEWLKHFGIDADGVVHNAIDAESFKSASSGRDFLAEYHIDPDEKTIVYTGRLVPEKGIIPLCKAFRELANEGNHKVKLFIAGDGILCEDIKKMESDSIHYLGRLSHSDIAALLSQCDIFCLPTVSEGFSTSMLEAAVSEMGIIVTDTGGARELMPNKDFGIIIKDNEIESIKRALEIYLADDSYLDSVREKVKDRVDNNFNWRNSANELLNLFSKVGVDDI